MPSETTYSWQQGPQDPPANPVNSMSSRSTRSRMTPPPALPPGTSLAKIKRLTIPVLQLYLKQYHLAQAGDKSAKAKRLYDYLQAHPGPTNSSTSSSSSESDSGSSQPEASRNNADGSSSESNEGDDQASAPFTMAQQKALAETIKSAMKATRGRKRLRVHHSPTLSPPSDRASKSRKSRTSRTSTRSKRTRHSRRSSSSRSSSHSSASTTLSSSDSSPHHHRRSSKSRDRERVNHHYHHRRAARHQHHTLPVPRKVRHAIERGEFVELHKLLSEHLILSGSASSSRSSRSHSTRSITGLDTWLEAWSIYAAVLSSSKPYLAAHLFQYQAFITRSSRRFRSYAWLQYDAQFRLKMASNPDMQWSSTDSELVASWLSADATKRTVTCYSCGSPDHMSTDCPLRDVGTSNSRCPVCNASGHTARHCPQLEQRPANPRPANSRPADPRTDNPRADEHCQLYNRRGSCFRGSKCPYRHVCSDCNGGHPKRACPRAR